MVTSGTGARLIQKKSVGQSVIWQHRHHPQHQHHDQQQYQHQREQQHHSSSSSSLRGERVLKSGLEWRFAGAVVRGLALEVWGAPRTQRQIIIGQGVGSHWLGEVSAADTQGKLLVCDVAMAGWLVQEELVQQTNESPLSSIPGSRMICTYFCCPMPCRLAVWPLSVNHIKDVSLGA